MSGNIMSIDTLATKLAGQEIDESQAEYLYGTHSVQLAKDLLQQRHHYQTVY